MSEPSGDREERERLIGQARKDLRDWADSGEEDLGVALVELLAVVGDLLSYYQDRVANEAYLGSGRGRPGGLRVEIDGERWHRQPDLAASGPEDRHFTVITQGGGAAIQFGDGEHGQRPSAGSEIHVRFRSGLGGAGNRFTSVRLQEGRVVIDADWKESAGDAYGVYRAVVLDNVDPLMTRRLRVRIPDVHGDDSVWAMACLQPGASAEVPSIGDAVWVAFDSGDPDMPVWLGRLYSVT
jgi:Type VI secretion system/phage-baseplate injector OB domain